jgi:hypothetical protein
VWISGVDFPQSLIDAHKAGTLVLFVGAGASMGPPSSLPNFVQLVERIRDESALTSVIGDVENGPLDEILGRMKDDHGVNVHECVARHIGAPGSLPNSAHRAIAKLASVKRPRIVTTNFDEHLTTSVDPSVAKYFAPALPMGDDFEGLVYLHGCLCQQVDQLIVTDRDFGRAYLTDAWAARFLERMFASYTVLLIGYSHNDVIMKYLARGLGRSNDRFILHADANAPLWKQLGIKPIEYKVDASGSHDALVQALDGLALHASMGLLDHRERVKSIVSSLVPPLTPEDNSYLEFVVSDEDTVKLFTDHARDPAWLQWAAARPEFRKLFEQRSGPTEIITERLAHWFAEHYVTEEHSGAALAVIYAAGGYLGPDLAWAIGRRLHSLSKPYPAALLPWLLIALRDTQKQLRRADFFDFILSDTLWTQDRNSALFLFTHMTEPELYLERGYFDGPRIEVGLRGDNYWLRGAWKDVFAPNLPEAAGELLPIVDHQLRRAHLELMVAEEPSAITWPSSSRAAIEPNPADDFPSPLGFLIDAARDCVESLLTTSPDEASAQLDRWAASEIPLLRRLAIHGWIERQDRSASEKLAWLRQQGWLLDYGLRQEIFRLLAATLLEVTSDIANAVVDAIVTGTDGDDYTRARAAHMLTFIAMHSPDPEHAQDARAAITSGHPDLQQPEDVGIADETDEPGADQRPTTADELHSKLEADACAVRDLLVEYETKTGGFDANLWQRIATLLRQMVQRWPEDGFSVLDAVGSGHSGIAQTVISGWAGADLTADQATRVLDRINVLDLPEVVSAVTRMLAGYRSVDDEHSTNWRVVAGSRDLAIRCWNAISPDTPSALEGAGWVTRAINHPAGHLTEFWIQSIESDWNANEDSWDGLPPATSDQLQTMLSSNDGRSEMAQVLITNWIHFLHNADATWCEHNVLPLLKWDDAERARRAWEGYLSHGKWTNQLLDGGLLELLFEAIKHREDFEERSGQILLGHLASIAMSADRDPREWLSTFLRQATLADRVEWAEQIAHYLRTAPSELAEQQWQRWMRSYWQDRLRNVPMEMTVEEASAMAQWVLYLTASTAEGIELALQYRAGMSSQSLFLHHLSNDGRVARSPDRFASLVAHLLEDTRKPFYGGYDLPDVVTQLESLGVSEDSLRRIEEHAERLGIPFTPG